MRRPRSWPARIGALLALLVVLGALATAAIVIRRHHKRSSIKAPTIVKVLIPEGSTRVQIAQLAHADGLTGSYLKASTPAMAHLDPSHYGAPAHEGNLEGFLFPATYELYVGVPAEKLVAAQLAAFAENFGAEEIRRAKALGVTPYGLLTVASMVEREAALPRERPLVAAVIYNRLRQGTPLGIDATIRYALHDYTHALTESQLHSSSPYNTRTHAGLPPTPIANPGSASIHAAAHPAHVSYLYYVARADGCPGQVFSTGYAQFEKDAAAYRQALQRNHGRVPACPKR
jgi:uncharacterized YceG family protein